MTRDTCNLAWCVQCHSTHLLPTLCNLCSPVSLLGTPWRAIQMIDCMLRHRVCIGLLLSLLSTNDSRDTHRSDGGHQEAHSNYHSLIAEHIVCYLVHSVSYTTRHGFNKNYHRKRHWKHSKCIFALNVHGKYQGKYRRKRVKEWCIMGDALMVGSTNPQG